MVGYEKALSTFPRRQVTRSQFTEAATLAGWQQRTIELFLRKPAFLDWFVCGKETLKVMALITGPKTNE